MRRRVLFGSAFVLIIGVQVVIAQKSSKGVVWVGEIGDTTTSSKGLPPWDLRDIAVDATGNCYLLRSGSLDKYGGSGSLVWSRRLKSGKEPGSFRYPSSLAVESNGNIYILDINRISILDPRGVFIRSFPVLGSPTKLWCWKDNRLLLLGSFQGNILCVYTTDGVRERSFGTPFESPWDLPQSANSARVWFVSNDTVWIANPWKYEIREYIGERLASVYEGRDKFPRPVVSESETGSLAIGTSNGIFGLTASQGRLLVSIAGPSGEGVLDEMTAGSLKLLHRIRNFPFVVRAADKSGQLFVIDDGKVKIGRLDWQ